MLALSLAIVVNVFPAKEVPKALGIWAAVSSSALAIGPLVGGVLVELDWRVIFWANLPLVALGALILVRAAPESSDPAAGHRIDWPGLGALSVPTSAPAPPPSFSSAPSGR
jgi:MFS family permease